MKQIFFSFLTLSIIILLTQCKEDESNVFSANTKAADSITSTSAILNAEVNANNLSTTIVFEWGLTSAYGNTDTADQSPLATATATKVFCKLDGLQPNTTYHYQVTATNSSGKIYGSDQTFTTLPLYYELPLIHTDYGNMLIWLYTQTPLHKTNFLSLTKTNYYDGLIFHRVVPNFVIQGGDPLGNGTGGPGYTIAAEFHDSLKHVYGAVGAARTNNPEKRSSGSQFYIVVNSAGTHSLDKNYTVFGLVINGMAAAEAIEAVACDANAKPLQDVVMTDVEIVTYTAEELKAQFNFTVPKF